MKRLPMNGDDLAALIGEFSDRHKRPNDAALEILATYSIPQSMLRELARRWLLELIDEHRHPVFAEAPE